MEIKSLLQEIINKNSLINEVSDSQRIKYKAADGIKQLDLMKDTIKHFEKKAKTNQKDFDKLYDLVLMIENAFSKIYEKTEKW